MRILAKGRLEVPVLDAVAIGVSVARADFKTAGSVMFLLRVGEILEEWTHKKTVSDLAKSMSLNTSHVWLWNGEQEVQVSISDIKPGDMIKVHMGNIIPFDGEVADGEGMVNQASLTGESLPVEKLGAPPFMQEPFWKRGKLHFVSVTESETAGLKKLLR